MSIEQAVMLLLASGYTLTGPVKAAATAPQKAAPPAPVPAAVEAPFGYCSDGVTPRKSNAGRPPSTTPSPRALSMAERVAAKIAEDDPFAILTDAPPVTRRRVPAPAVAPEEDFLTIL